MANHVTIYNFDVTHGEADVTTSSGQSILSQEASDFCNSVGLACTAETLQEGLIHVHADRASSSCTVHRVDVVHLQHSIVGQGIHVYHLACVLIFDHRSGEALTRRISWGVGSLNRKHS